jgi:uncharacterized protein YggU (UPF0235/DUF167 family)
MTALSTRVRLRVSPGSGRAEVVGRYGDGRANEAVLRLLATKLAVPRETLSLVSGHSGRDKIVELTGLGPALIERRLASAAAPDRSRKDRRS